MLFSRAMHDFMRVSSITIMLFTAGVGRIHPETRHILVSNLLLYIVVLGTMERRIAIGQTDPSGCTLICMIVSHKST